VLGARRVRRRRGGDVRAVRRSRPGPRRRRPASSAEPAQAAARVRPRSDSSMNIVNPVERESAPDPMTDNTLSTAQGVHFHQEGYVGPFAACSVAEMAEIRAFVDREVLPTPGPDPTRSIHARHLDTPLVRDLVSRPAILGRLQCILGDNIVIWSSNFWN